MNIRFYFDKYVEDADDFQNVMEGLEMIGASDGANEGELHFRGQLIGRWKVE